MGKRVLVVDDANFMRMIVRDMLTPNGFEICGEATNGIEAVTKYMQLKPDLVTMDITMREKDGRRRPGKSSPLIPTRGSSW